MFVVFLEERSRKMKRSRDSRRARTLNLPTDVKPSRRACRMIFQVQRELMTMFSGQLVMIYVPWSICMIYFTYVPIQKYLTRGWSPPMFRFMGLIRFPWIPIVVLMTHQSIVFLREWAAHRAFPGAMAARGREAAVNLDTTSCSMRCRRWRVKAVSMCRKLVATRSADPGPCLPKHSPEMVGIMWSSGYRRLLLLMPQDLPGPLPDWQFQPSKEVPFILSLYFNPGNIYQTLHKRCIFIQAYVGL